MTDTLIVGFGALLTGVWAWLTVRAVQCLRDGRLTERVRGQPVPRRWPRVSVIVPARNEADHIEACLSSLLALDYPAVEVIAVDDRSTDGTSTIMEQLCRTDPRLRVIPITALPDGWLGKTHAMHQGAREAQGEFLLFTDGDIVFAPNTLSAAITYLDQEHLDHLCLLPKALPGGYWENALTQFIGLLFLLITRPWAMGQGQGVYAGVGAFNLVRAELYQALGGHERLRAEVVDDLRLGQAILTAGGRSRMLLGDDLLQLRWHTGVGGLIRGIEKNSFAAMGFSWRYLTAFTLGYLILFLLPYGGLLMGDARALGYAGAVILMHGLFSYKNQRAGTGWPVGLALPIAAVLGLWALWRSAVLTAWRGGIRWRDTFYPIGFFKGKS